MSNRVEKFLGFRRRRGLHPGGSGVIAGASRRFRETVRADIEYTASVHPHPVPCALSRADSLAYRGRRLRWGERRWVGRGVEGVIQRAIVSFEHRFEYDLGMGTNRRYPSDASAEKMKPAVPLPAADTAISLSDEELDKAHQQLFTAGNPVRARAWVRFGSLPVQVECRAVAWTKRAVLVEWDTPEAAGVGRVWGWASAVERPPSLNPSRYD